MHNSTRSNLSGRKRNLLFTLITVVFVFGAIEGISWLGLKLLDKRYDIRYRPMLPTKLSPKHQKSLERFIKDDIEHTGFSAALGWTIKPNSNAAEGTYVSNSKKIRATREYSLSPPADKVRIATFGDSYTFGMEVRNEQTWQEQLVALDNNFEILNFGLGGHGLDQAYLRYLDEGTVYSADIVIVGFMTENINRVVSVYRPYYVEQTGIPLTKARFILEGNELKLIKNPHQRLEDYKKLLANPESVLPTLGEHDFYYHSRYSKHSIDFLRSVRLGKMVVHDLFTKKIYDRQRNYNERSEAYQIMLKLFEAFHSSAIKNGSLPVVLIYPDFSDVIAMKRKKPKKYQALLSWLQANNYLYVDLMDVITLFGESNKMGAFFTKRFGHYSPLGNQLVANHVLKFLTKNKLNTRHEIDLALNNKIGH